MTIDEMIAVLQASKDGKAIEGMYKFGIAEEWKPAPLFWDFRSYLYRVKPEPMEIEVWMLQDGKYMELVKPFREQSHYREWTKKKFREVIE